MIERCAGGVKLDFKKRCATCGAGPGDQCAKAALRDFEERQTLVKALNAACGYLLNAKIDLETGCTKAAAIKTIEGGLKMAREALATVEPRSNADVGISGGQGERS